MDRYQNADEPVAKRPNSTGGEQQVEIMPLRAGVTHWRCWSDGRVSKTSRTRRTLKRDFLEIGFRTRFGLDRAAIWPSYHYDALAGAARVGDFCSRASR